MQIPDPANPGQTIPLPDESVYAVAAGWYVQSRTILEAVRRALDAFVPSQALDINPAAQQTIQRHANELRTYIRNRQKMAEEWRRLSEIDALNEAGIAFDPNNRKSIQSGVAQLAQQRPDLKDLLDDAIDLIYADRDRDFMYMGRLTEDIVERTLGQGPLREALAPQTAHDLLAMQRDLERQSMGLREFMGTLPAEQAAVGQQYEGLLSRLASQVGADRARVVKALRGIKGLPEDVKSPEELVQYLYQMGILEEPVLSGWRLVEALKGRNDLLDPKDFLTIQNAVGRWASKGDLFLDDPMLLIGDRFYSHVLRQLQAIDRPLGERGLPGAKEQVASIFREATRLWKENTLASPDTSMLNFISGHIFNGLAGHMNVGRVLRNQAESFQNILADPSRPGPHWYSQSIQEFLGKLGLSDVPQSLGASLTNTILESISGDPRTATERVPAWLRSVIGAGVNAGSGPVGAVVGALQGLVAPRQVRFFQVLNRAIETGARTSIWQDVMERELARRADDYAQHVAQVLGEPRTRLGGQVIQADVQAVSGLTDWIRQTQGLFPIKELDSRLTQATRGAQPDEVNNLVREWSEHQFAASKAGVQETHRIHFNYSKMNNLEEWLRQFIPFHKWATGAIPFYADRIAEHPALGIMLARLYSGSDQEKEELGLGPRFENTVGMSGAEWLAHVILGRPGEIRVNPSNLLFPFANVTGGIEKASKESNPLAAALDVASSVGFGVSPLAQIPLIAAGALGPEQPLPNLNRHSPLYGLLPGANAPSESAWQNAVNALTNRNQFNPNTYNVQKRLAEMAVERTGRPISQVPTLMGAVVDPSRPIAQQAQADVLSQRGRQRLLNMFLPLSAQALPASEKAIGLARKTYPKGPIDTNEEREQLRQAIQANPLGQGYASVRGTVDAQELVRGRQVLDNPSALFPDAPPAFLNHLDALWRIYKQADPRVQAAMRREQPALGIMAERQRQYLQSSPILQSYLVWAQMHPNPRAEGDPSREQQFLEWYRTIKDRLP